MTRSPSVFLMVLVLCGSAATAFSQAKEVLLFKDGDRLTGEIRKIESGSLRFFNTRTGEITIESADIAEIKSTMPFAVFRRGDLVNRANAIVGIIELHGSDLTILQGTVPPIHIDTAEVAEAIEFQKFEQEMSRKHPLRQGWEIETGLGITLVRSTENGMTINTELKATRSIPDVPVLPARNKTILEITDSYERVTAPAVDGPSAHNETHVFHASLEREEYLTRHLFVLGNYSFDSNYAQGLLAEQAYGAGFGWTFLHGGSQTLDLKSSLERRTQGFNDFSLNTHLIGQKIEETYERTLSHAMNLSQSLDFKAAYNRPEDYAGNGTIKLQIPIYKSLGVSLTITDNYLNNASPGDQKNSYRFITNLTYSFR